MIFKFDLFLNSHSHHKASASDVTPSSQNKTFISKFESLIEAKVNIYMHEMVFIWGGDTSLIRKTVPWLNYQRGGTNPSTLMPRVVCRPFVQNKPSRACQADLSPLKSKSQVSILGSVAYTGLDSLASGRFKWKWNIFHTPLAHNCLVCAVLACWLLLLRPHHLPSLSFYSLVGLAFYVVI